MIRSIKYSFLASVVSLAGAVLVLVSSCTKDSQAEDVPVAGNRPASIEVAVALPELYVTTRNEELKPKTAWAALVDGQVLYRVSIFLIRKELDGKKKIISCRDIDFTKPNPPYYDAANVKDGFVRPDADKAVFPFGYPQQAKFHFDKTDGVTEGLYDLIVIANGSGISADGKTYGGITALQTLVDNLLLRVGTNKEKISMTDPDVDKLMNNALLNAGVDGICPQTPMMLSRIEGNNAVIPGQNSFQTSLMRSRARVRIEVTNLSENHWVNIGGLSFGTIAQREADVFGAKKFPAKRTMPKVASADALTPFMHSSESKTAQHIPGLNHITADQSNTQVVFDGYILESGLSGTERAEDIYSYRIKLNHSANSSGEGSVPNEQDADVDVYVFDEAVQPIKDAGLLYSNTPYILKNKFNAFFLTEKNGTPVGQNLKNKQVVTDNYLWIFEKGTNDKIHMKSVSRSNSPDPNISGMPFLGGKDFRTFGKEGKFLTLTGKDGIGISWVDPGAGSWWHDVYYTLRIDNNGVVGANKHETDPDYTNAAFFFYEPASDVIRVPAKDVYTRPMRYINKHNENKVEQVRQIHRNDFVHIRVSVRYNDQTGLLEFTTTDWNDKQEDIEFD